LLSRPRSNEIDAQQADEAAGSLRRPQNIAEPLDGPAFTRANGRSADEPESDSLMALTQQDLKSTLWDAANTLRGSAVDRTDWKGYILPLLFFKRICDVWDE
jgi:hypothetical protein